MASFGGPAVLAAAAFALGSSTPAAAQTAYEINRLNQAIQICNSPAGAAMAECAKLRGQLGMAPAASTAGAVVGLGGLFGQAIGGRGAAPAPAPNTAALQQSIAACVRDAAENQVAVQACLTRAERPIARQAPFAGPGPFAPRPAGGDAATSIHRAGQSYQACAAANPNNWRACLPLLNGGSAAQAN